MQTNDKVTKENIYRKICVLSPLEKPEYRQFDGISFSRLFSDLFSSVLRFNTTANSYIVYDGIRWKRDEGNITAERYAKLFGRALQQYAYEREEAPRDFIKAAQGFGDYNKRRTLIADARSYNALEQKELDNYPYLLNCRNGVLNLETLELIPHDPELLLSKVANFVYDPHARSDLFETFINDVMIHDQSKIQYIQTLLGSSLIGENMAEEFYIFFGISTRNGKSTLLNTVQFLLGDYACTIRPESLAQVKESNGHAPSGDIARLDGIRFLQCPEPPKRMKLNVELVKSLTGGDIITARHLHEREFDFVPVFTLFMNTNYLPVVLDNSLFASGRVKVIEFNRHYEPHEQDTRLKQKLKSSENLSGIANWLLSGLKTFHINSDRFIVPKCVEEATEAYKDKSDKVKAFFSDRMTKDDNCTVSAKSVYEEYVRWCHDNGYGTENKGNFFEDLRSRGLLSPTGTISGITARNVVKGYSIDHVV